MESLGLFAVLLVLGWQVFALRRDVDAQAYPTTVFYSVESEERSASGVAESSVHFRKKLGLPIAVVAGMEFAGVANNTPTSVVRVVFDTEGRGVHLKPGLAAMKGLEEIKRWYVSREWISDA